MDVVVDIFYLIYSSDIYIIVVVMFIHCLGTALAVELLLLL